jgi:hypothetical protein
MDTERRAMGTRGFALSLAACLALTLVGLIGVRNVDPQRVAGFDDLHWTAACAAAVLLAWRGLALARVSVRQARPLASAAQVGLKSRARC